MNGITILGLVAATFTTISFLPQVIKCWKTKRTKDISFPAFILLFIGGSLWLTYGLLIQDLPVIIANAIVDVLIVIILLLKLKYG